MNKEKGPSLARRIETNTEKWGGGLITILGAISLNAPAAAFGLALIVIGIARTPKAQT